MNASQRAASGAEGRPARLAVGVVGAGRVGPALAAALPAGRAPAGRRLRRLRRLPAPRRRPCCPTCRWSSPPQVLAARRPGAADRPRRRPARRWSPARRDRRRTPRAAPGAHLGPLRHRRAGPRPPRRRAAARAAPGDDLHRHPASTCSGWPAARSASPPPSELRLAAEALVIEMGGEPEWIAGGRPPALPRGPRHRLEPPGHPGRPGDATCCAQAGVAEPGRMLGPLLGAALDNALRSGDAALTGPVARGDAGTRRRATWNSCARHAPDTVAAYLAMARATADRALANGMLKPEYAAALLGRARRRGGAGEPQRPHDTELGGSRRPRPCARPAQPGRRDDHGRAARGPRAP